MAPRFLALCFLLLSSSVAAQSDCRPAPKLSTTVVDRGAIKSVVGQLAPFDPCHRSVRLATPSFFAKKRGEKPPLVIIVHGGGGLSEYETAFANLLNQNGYAALLFDAFEMNGLVAGSQLVLYNMTNEARQRMIFKATVGAYERALKNEKIDSQRLVFFGLSNGGSVAINMAGAVDPQYVKAVIAEGAPAAGIGFPNELKVPLLMLYGGADNYGGTNSEDWMHLRGIPCFANEHYRWAPPGFSETCNRFENMKELMPTPIAWYEKIKSSGASVNFELLEGGGHGMMFNDFFNAPRQIPGRGNFYLSYGADAKTRARAQKIILDFIESKL